MFMFGGRYYGIYLNELYSLDLNYSSEDSSFDKIKISSHFNYLFGKIIIDENDYQVKMRAMKSFIEEGDKVKVTLRFRGREMAHQDIGVRVLERIRSEMDLTTKVEQMPRLENRQMVMVLSPR